ncbi:MAG: hypothetical protein ACKVS8_03890 [Phycisphaerales bacterium]
MARGPAARPSAWALWCVSAWSGVLAFAEFVRLVWQTSVRLRAAKRGGVRAMGRGYGPLRKPVHPGRRGPADHAA